MMGFGRHGGWGGEGWRTQAAPNPALQKDFQKLGTDLQAVHDKSQVTPAMQAVVRNDLQQIQKEATTAPDQTAVTTLANDLKNLNGALPSFTQGQVQTDFEAVLKSEGLNDPALVTKTETDLNTVVQATNITAADVQTLQADRQAIQTDSGAGSTTTAATTSSPGTTAPGAFPGGPMHGLLGGVLAGVISGRPDAFPGGPMGGRFGGMGRF
jgi:hypothetical protein